MYLNIEFIYKQEKLGDKMCEFLNQHLSDAVSANHVFLRHQETTLKYRNKNRRRTLIKETKWERQNEEFNLKKNRFLEKRYFASCKVQNDRAL